MPRNRVSFDISSADSALVEKIVDRFVGMATMLGQQVDRLSTTMDLVATKANGCPLDFQRLLDANDTDFAHDVIGIEQHLDRTTGKLTNLFCPRAARGFSKVAA